MSVPEDLVEFFWEYWREQVAALGAAVERGELGEVRRVAHNLRGSAAQFGYAGLSTLAGAVEAAAVCGDAGGVADSWVALRGGAERGAEQRG